MRKIPFVKNEYYHIYNRGTNKMNIFNVNSDYDRFQKLLYIANSNKTPQYSDINKNLCPTWKTERGETLVDIGAYCLMPNHFHILIKVKEEKNASLFLQRVLTSHSKYINIKNQRTGSLFQGKSKTQFVKEDTQLKYLFSYIHLNPVKLIEKNWKDDGIKDTNKVKEFLYNYKYSSYLDYLEERIESKILNKTSFPEYFSEKKLFENEIFEWFNYKNEIFTFPMSDIGKNKL